MRKIQFCTRKVKGVLIGIGTAAAATLATTPAHAALDLTGVSVDTTAFYAIAALLVGALVGFWGTRRALAFFNR